MAIGDRTVAPKTGSAATLQEWGELEGPPFYDLVDGILEERPGVSLWHEILLSNLLCFLQPYCRARSLGTILFSAAKLRVSLITGRQPDVYLLPVDQYHLAGRNYFFGVPPFVVEILSESAERVDRVRKYRGYAELGVGEYWIIDAPDRTIEIHRLQTRPDGKREYELAEQVRGDAVFRPTLFPGLDIPLAKIWPTEFEHRTDTPPTA